MQKHLFAVGQTQIADLTCTLLAWSSTAVSLDKRKNAPVTLFTVSYQKVLVQGQTWRVVCQSAVYICRTQPYSQPCLGFLQIQVRRFSWSIFLVEITQKPVRANCFCPSRHVMHRACGLKKFSRNIFVALTSLAIDHLKWSVIPCFFFLVGHFLFHFSTDCEKTNQNSMWEVQKFPIFLSMRHRILAFARLLREYKCGR